MTDSKSEMNQSGELPNCQAGRCLCEHCGMSSQTVWVHGHEQCTQCGINRMPCCEGETLNPISDCGWLHPEGKTQKAGPDPGTKKSSSERIHSKTNETGSRKFKYLQIPSCRSSFKIRNLASQSTESIPFPENKRSESKL